MEKEKDEDLDKLFKKGMEDPVNEPVYRETDWDAMEHMLDERKKRGGVVYRLYWIGSAAALVLLFLGWWLYRPQVTKNNNGQQNIAVHPTKGHTGTSGGATVQTADSSKQNIPNTARYATSAIHPAQGKKNKAFLPLSAGGSRRNATGYAATTKVANESKAGVADAQNQKNKELIAYDNKNTIETTTANGKKDNATVNNGTAIANNTTQTSPDKKESSRVDTDRSNSKSIAANTITTNASPDKKELSQANAKTDKGNANTLATAPASKTKVKGLSKTNSPNHAVFAISAIASSDMNGETPLSGGRVGGNFGGTFSVNINKWTFSTGMMYSIKPYAEGFADYHTSYVFSTNPTSIAANCRMLDIPLNVNYQVYSSHGNKITVGSGLSSYIILRENYTFNYTDPYNEGPAGYNVINKNRNILGILNLDATYDHRINSKFGITFQPYYKIPLSNVGASQVKLQSTGVAVGLNWNLNSFRKPD